MREFLLDVFQPSRYLVIGNNGRSWSGKSYGPVFGVRNDYFAPVFHRILDLKRGACLCTLFCFTSPCTGAGSKCSEMLIIWPMLYFLKMHCLFKLMLPL